MKKVLISGLEFMQNLMVWMLAVFGGLCGVFVGIKNWKRYYRSAIRTLKEESRLTRETIQATCESLQAVMTEEARLTREMIERVTERVRELIASKGQKTRELIRS